MTFHVGQKVVCIKDGGWEIYTTSGNLPKKLPQDPRKGEIYAIAEIDPCDGMIFLGFEEIGDSLDVKTFLSDWFRPVCTTDISVFRALLVTPPRQKVKA